MAEGKINMNVDGSETHYDVQYAVDQMIRNGRFLSLLRIPLILSGMALSTS